MTGWGSTVRGVDHEAAAGLIVVGLAFAALVTSAPAKLVAAATIVAAGGSLVRDATSIGRGRHLIVGPWRRELAVSVGFVALLLGALAVVGVHPTMLVSVAVIGLGGALVIGGATPALEPAPVGTRLAGRPDPLRPGVGRLIGFEAIIVGAVGQLHGGRHQPMLVAAAVMVIGAGLAVPDVTRLRPAAAWSSSPRTERPTQALANSTTTDVDTTRSLIRQQTVTVRPVPVTSGPPAARISGAVAAPENDQAPIIGITSLNSNPTGSDDDVV